MSKLGQRLIRTIQDTVKMVRDGTPARVTVWCEKCSERIMVTYLPGPKERFMCSKCADRHGMFTDDESTTDK